MMQAASALSLPQLGQLLHGWWCSTISIFINLTKIPANNDDGTENEKLCSINGANVSFYGLHIKCKLLKRQQPETPDSQRERERHRGREWERRATATCGEAAEQQLLQYLESVCSCLLFSTFLPALHTFFSPLSCPRGCTVCCLLRAVRPCLIMLHVTLLMIICICCMPRPRPKWERGPGAEWQSLLPLWVVRLVRATRADPTTMKSVTWKSRNKCFGSHLWKSPMRRRQRRQLATVVVVAVVVVASWSFIKNT